MNVWMRNSFDFRRICSNVEGPELAGALVRSEAYAPNRGWSAPKYEPVPLENVARLRGRNTGGK